MDVEIIKQEHVAHSGNLQTQPASNKVFQRLEPEVVEKHPLARSSSGSSSSSLELDNNTTFSQTTQNKKPSRPMKVRQPSVGRLRDLLSKYDDDKKLDAPDGNLYYSSASVLWQNRSKIFSDLKKQATESVRSLTQSTSLDNVSNQGFFYKPNDDSSNTIESSKTNALPSSHSGLSKLEAETIDENQKDSDVSTFLLGLKEKVSDPLQILKHKDDEDKQKDDEFLNEPKYTSRSRAVTSSSASSSSPIQLQPGNIRRRRKADNVSPARQRTADNFKVSLSALIAGKNDGSAEDDISTYEISSKNDIKALSDELSPSYDVSKGNNPSADSYDETGTSNHAQDGDNASEWQPSLTVVLFFTMLVYSYFVLPLPYAVHLVLMSFVSGCFITVLFLCLVAARSSRPQPFLRAPLTRSLPQKIPKTIYDPDTPIKGWMNEISSYNPDSYHVSNTHSVYVTLDGATMRLQTPNKSIPRRSVFNEGIIHLSNVVHQRMFDITFAKVYLRPPGLVKKRVWSKKYPICIEIPLEKSHEDKLNKGAKTKENASYNDPDQNSTDCRILYLFGRTDRQKEEWFYRIQRTINHMLRKHKKKQKDLTETSSPERAGDWGLIEDNGEKDSVVASNIYDMTKMNEEPLQILQEYFVHVSNLFPDAFSGSDSCESIQSTRPEEVCLSHVRETIVTEEKPASFKEPASSVIWLNVFLGRIMFDFLRQPEWIKWVALKIQRKLDKIKLPYFMDELKLVELNLGSSAPVFHAISQPRLNAQGIWFDSEITYSGSAQMTLKTKLVLTKLGKNETTLVDKESSSRSDAITNSDAEDSAESSEEEEDESTVSRIVGQVQSAVSKLDGQQIIKEAVKTVSKDPINTESSRYSSNATIPPYNTLPSGPPPKKWIRIVDSITKSKYFQKATETEYIRKKLETVSNTPVLLTVELQQLKGTLVINVAPPPTDRVWYGFREPPLMLLKAQPKVGERVVKTTHVTDWIENKLQQEVTKVLVLPNMDDIQLPTMYHNRPPS